MFLKDWQIQSPLKPSRTLHSVAWQKCTATRSMPDIWPTELCKQVLGKSILNNLKCRLNYVVTTQQGMFEYSNDFQLWLGNHVITFPPRDLPADREHKLWALGTPARPTSVNGPCVWGHRFRHWPFRWRKLVFEATISLVEIHLWNWRSWRPLQSYNQQVTSSYCLAN